MNLTLTDAFVNIRYSFEYIYTYLFNLDEENRIFAMLVVTIVVFKNIYDLSKRTATNEGIILGLFLADSAWMLPMIIQSHIT